MTIPTTTADKPVSTFSDALSRIHNTGQAPDDRSGDLERLCMMAQAAEDAYSEAEYQFDHAEDGTPVKEILRRAYQQAYDTWQNIERAGLPLLHQYQRETLGYSEDELTPATER